MRSGGVKQMLYINIPMHPKRKLMLSMDSNDNLVRQYDRRVLITQALSRRLNDDRNM